MSRSLKKGFFIDYKLLIKVIRFKKLGLRSFLKTWSRRSTIIPEMVGLNVEVHNGNKFIRVFVTENMVGHKLGEFAHTRIFKKHPSAAKKNSIVKK